MTLENYGLKEPNCSFNGTITDSFVKINLPTFNFIFRDNNNETLVNQF